MSDANVNPAELGEPPSVGDLIDTRSEVIEARFQALEQRAVRMEAAMDEALRQLLTVKQALAAKTAKAPKGLAVRLDRIEAHLREQSGTFRLPD